MGKKRDILVLLCITILGVIITWELRETELNKALIVGIITLSPQIIYLALIKRKNWSKIGWATLTFGFLFGYFLEFLNEYNKAYQVTSFLFPSKVFGVLPPDNLIGHGLMTVLTITFYQHFIQEKINKPVSKKFYFISLIALIANLIITVTYFRSPSLLKIKYPYLVLGSAAIIPIITLAWGNPPLIKNMLLIIPYFFCLYFLSEIIAVKLNYWIYPGNNYVGWVKIANLRFPFEELFFWMLCYPAALVSYYEIFLENN